MEGAISQLKSLAARGHNVFQPDAAAPVDLYECIWANENGPAVERRPCPTNGHNLSDITELSEGSTASSNKSKSSLVATVDAIMDGSLCETSSSSLPPCQQQEENKELLTYVEVSFLSKLDGIVMDKDADVVPQPPARRPAARRQFSIIREQFGPPVKASPPHHSNNRSSISHTEEDKENQNRQSSLNKVKTTISKKHEHQSTLSPHSRIFSP